MARSDWRKTLRLLAQHASVPAHTATLSTLETERTFIGWFCLKPCLIALPQEGGGWLEATEHVEVGYRLAQRFWGHGYATEMARALVQYGLEQLDLKAVVGAVDPGNHASRGVLEKAGLRYRSRGWYFDSKVDVYDTARESTRPR